MHAKIVAIIITTIIIIRVGSDSLQPSNKLFVVCKSRESRIEWLQIKLVAFPIREMLHTHRGLDSE